MKLNFFNKVLFSSLCIVIVWMMISCIAHPIKESLGILVGAAWGFINLLFLKNVLNFMLLPSKKGIQFLIYLVLKWPVLYLTGFFLIKTHFFSVTSLLVGFSIVLFMTCTVGLFEFIGYKKNNT